MKGTVQARHFSNRGKGQFSRPASAGRLCATYPRALQQGLEFTRKLERRSPRLLLAVFSLAFLFLCFTITWVAAAGRPIFGMQIAGVDENDLFYLMFLENEARGAISSANGRGASSTLKLSHYEVTKDDTLSRIAAQTGVSLDALISLNKISDAHTLRVGQQLTIPNQRGIYYEVKRGDTIEKIAQAHRISGDAIQEVNGLLRGSQLETGSVVFLPGARLSADEMDRALGMLFVRPTAGGRMSSGFGYRRHPITHQHRFHAGMDIALPYGTPIVAARSGQVTFAGWNGGYGRMVSIRHTDGYSSLYGHMQRFVVSNGQQVRAGQKIGYVGSTGNSTGPHLHFELRHNGRLVNPMQVPGFRRAFGR